MPFYLTVLLEQSVNLLAAMVGGLVLLSLVWYYPINRLSSRWGKKRLVLFAMGLASAFFALLFFLGKMLPFSYAVQLVLIPVLGSLPISILGMLPTAILADIAVHDAATTATSNEGMFFAARTLLQKLGQTFGVMCFAGLTKCVRACAPIMAPTPQPTPTPRPTQLRLERGR